MYKLSQVFIQHKFEMLYVVWTNLYYPTYMNEKWAQI